MFVHRKKRIWPKVIIAVLIVALLAGAGGVFGLRKWYESQLLPASGSAEVIQVTIDEGMSPKEIATLLQEKGLIRNIRAFETYIRGNGSAGSLKAGTFELSASMSTQEVVAVLVSGKEASTLFTIGPGLRVDQIRKRLVNAGYTEQDVDEALKVEKYSDIGIVGEIKPGASLEGFIYPETFRVNVNSTPEEIIRQSLVELDKTIDDDMRSAFGQHGLSVYEAITLASIVEKEVPSNEDRRIVAQIFLSRLSEGISLGSDATYYYASAVFGGEPFPTLDSPYNTRIYAGLPPGPINNVSKTALEAVAYPSDTDYLFFVTGDDGVNHYTRTEAEHNAAVKLFCTISCATGYVPDELQ